MSASPSASNVLIRPFLFFSTLVVLLCTSSPVAADGERPTTSRPEPRPAQVLRPLAADDATIALRKAPPGVLYLYGEPGSNEGTFQDLAMQPDWQGWTTIDVNESLLGSNHWHPFEVDLGPAGGTLTPPSLTDLFGRSLASVDSLAGDERKAIAVGAQTTSGNGRVAVYMGTDIARGTPTWTLNTTNGDLGYSVADMGDIDGDGDHELLVGAPPDKAYAYFGEPSTGLDNAFPDLVFDVPAGPIANFGKNVAGIGDFNGDGFDDWVIAAGKQLFLYLGSATPDATHDLETGFSHIFYTGWAIAGGDVTGDGFSDLIMSSPGPVVGGVSGSFVGMVAVYPGSSTPTLSSGTTTFTNGDPDGGFGASLALVAPVGGGPAPDLIVGEPFGNAGQGRVYRYTGGGPTPALAETWTGNVPNGNLGSSVAPMPSLAGAGTTAFVAGEPGAASTGRARVYRTGALNEVSYFAGETSGGRFGTRVVDASALPPGAAGFAGAAPEAGVEEVLVRFLEPVPTHYLYCGDQTPPPEWIAGGGYGNNWHDTIGWYGPPPDPGQPTHVCMQAQMRVETEVDYDGVVVEYETTAGLQQLARYDGTIGIHTMSWCADYAPVDYVVSPYTAEPSVHLRFRVDTDGAWSDETGEVDTEYGAVLLSSLEIRMDDVLVSQAPMTPDASDDAPDGRGFAGFETGGWFREDVLYGDFAKLVTGFVDVDPIRENATPQVSFIDDGTPPSNDALGRGTGGTTGTTTYGVPGGWVVPRGPGLSAGLFSLNNEIWSPPIIWDDTGTTGDDGYDHAVVSFDLWADLPLEDGIFFTWNVRYFDGANWSPWLANRFLRYNPGEAHYATQQFSIGDLIPVDAQQIQVALGAIDGADFYGLPGTNSRPSPLFDNVRVYKQFDSVSESVTPSGAAVPVDLGEVQLEFADVQSAGTTTVVQELAQGAPYNFFLATDPRLLYQITTTATFSDSVRVCITYDEGDLQIPEEDMRLIHLEDGDWIDITQTHDLAANTICGKTASLSPFALAIQVSTTDAPVPDRVPDATRLHPARPNPFNPETRLTFDLDRPARVSLRVFDLRGRLVRTLFTGRRDAGVHDFDWNGRDDEGRSVASGVYLVRLETPAGQFEQKVSLIK